jgi:hypothetical protein
MLKPLKCFLHSVFLPIFCANYLFLYVSSISCSSHPSWFNNYNINWKHLSGFGGLKVACWPLVPKFASSHPAKTVKFLGWKVLSTPSFRGEVKPSDPCRSFTARKRSLNVTCKTAFRQNYRTFLTHSSTFRRWAFSRGDTCGDTWWRKLEHLTKTAQ